MRYDLNHNPSYGKEELLVSGINVITARNKSAYTFSGTRTYIVGENLIAVIDPGPDIVEHFDAIINCIGKRKVTHIFLTHTHLDHCELAIKLALRVCAPIYLFAGKSEAKLSLLRRLSAKNIKKSRSKELGGQIELKKVFHGQKIVGSGWSFEILHTPGHTDDHICLAWQEKQVIFSGDHVMGWSSTMINYPSGNMINYFKSLKLLLTRSETLFFPGHGKPIKDALNFTSWQLNHKLDREKQIFTLICNSPKDAKSLVSIIYKGLDKNLHSAAESNIYAHLIALVEKGKIVANETNTPNSKFSIKFCKK